MDWIAILLPGKKASNSESYISNYLLILRYDKAKLSIMYFNNFLQFFCRVRARNLNAWSGNSLF